MNMLYYGVPCKMYYRRKSKTAPPCEGTSYYSIDNGESWLTTKQMKIIVDLNKQFGRKL